MKSLLIAASMATVLIGMAVPAAAQDRRDGVTRTTTTERVRGEGEAERHVVTTRTTSRSVRHTHWGARHCHNVKRHHRWVRVCTRG